MDSEPLILSALNDYLYCPRRCYLHRVEGLWVANAYTISGELAHSTVDDPGYRRTLDEAGGALRIERALPLFCRKLNLVGKSDIVEFHADPGGGPAIPLPVDYKLGRRSKWDNDDAQLCAQALCLEEMFAVSVPAGAVYHVATRRRRAVAFTPQLRDLTLRVIEAIRDMLAGQDISAAGQGDSPAGEEAAGRRVPPAVLRPQCQGCSMHGMCLPELGGGPDALDRAHAVLFTARPAAVAEPVNPIA